MESLLDFTRRYEFGFIMGLGVRVLGFTLEGRYESSNGIDKASGINTKFHTLYGLAGYTF